MRPLGGRRIVDSPDGIGYGRDRPELWIMPREATNGNGTGDGAARRQTTFARAVRGGHVAISAAGRRAVDAAHEAGLPARGGGRGVPPPRPPRAPPPHP